jgi:hypothetical protein
MIREILYRARAIQYDAYAIVRMALAYDGIIEAVSVTGVEKPETMTVAVGVESGGVDRPDLSLVRRVDRVGYELRSRRLASLAIRCGGTELPEDQYRCASAERKIVALHAATSPARHLARPRQEH